MVFRVFCPERDIDFITFCLKRGIFTGLTDKHIPDSYPVAIYLIRNNLAGEIWSEINYAARGAFWEGTKTPRALPRASIYSRIQSSLISKAHK